MFSDTHIIETMISDGSFNNNIGTIKHAIADLRILYEAGKCTAQNYEYLKNKLEELRDKA